MNPQQAYALNRSAVVSDVIEGVAVIVNLDRGTYYSLNETGSVVWSALQQGPVHAESLAQVLASQFDGEPAAIHAAVEEALGRLLAEGLVNATGEPPPVPAQIGTPPAGERQPFVPPVLDVYDDMQDFLLIDPIHEVDAAGNPELHRK